MVFSTCERLIKIPSSIISRFNIRSTRNRFGPMSMAWRDSIFWTDEENSPFECPEEVADLFGLREEGGGLQLSERRSMEHLSTP